MTMTEMPAELEQAVRDALPAGCEVVKGCVCGVCYEPSIVIAVRRQ